MKKDYYPGMCDGRSIWTIDLRKHNGRNPKIVKSILKSENYHALHSRLYDGMHWFFAGKNIDHDNAGVDDIVLLQTLSCGRTR